MRWLIWVAFASLTLAVLAAGAMYLRLSHGPVHLPYAANLAVRLFNEDSDRFTAAVGDMVLTLGDADSPSGVQFVDLRIADADGQVLFAVPRLSARFDTAALIRGEVRPTEIVLVRPQARLVRMADGRFRFGLGNRMPGQDGAGPRPGAPQDGADEAAQVEAIARVFDGLTGDVPLTPELSRLSEVRIVRPSFTYENAQIGRSWQTRRADLTIGRTETGMVARMAVDLADGSVAGAGVIVTARRKRGSQTIEVEAEFRDLRPEHLAEQVEQMQWLALFDAPLDGHLYASLDRMGELEALSGKIDARAGRILADEGVGRAFDSATLDFAYAPGLERMRIGSFTLASPAVFAQLTGLADLRRNAEGDVTGLAGQLEVIRIDARVPEVFAAPLTFDGGQIVARLNLEPTRLDVATAYLSEGDLVLDVAGAAWVDRGAWRTDLRAEGRNLTVPQLLQHWPVIAAPDPRAWVAENILGGAIDHVVAQMRLGGEEERLNLDFRFSELSSTYLAQMTPIRAAAGWGSLTLGQFALGMDGGAVEPVTGLAVDLTGSDFRVLDIQNHPWPAVATIRARGPTRAVLALINEQPLGFMDKLGLRASVVQGTAEVEAEVRLPLLSDLALEDVEVQARSTLEDLHLPFTLPDGQVLDVASRRVGLDANKESMLFAGPLEINGKSLEIEWNEYFADGPVDRTIALAGPATTALLADFDLETEYFTGGQAPMNLRLAQTGGQDFSFEVEADLGPAVIEIPEFYWTKAPGKRGRLTATGTFGDRTNVSRFTIESADLIASGSAEFAAGSLQAAAVERLRFRGLADISLTARRSAEGGYTLIVGGNSLDLTLFDEPPDAASPGPGAASAPAVPLTVDFDIGEMRITPKVAASPASGNFSRDAARKATAQLAGRIGDVPFTAEYEKEGDQPATLRALSDNAGGLLRAAGLFPGATGGSLKLRAQIAPAPGTDLVGLARIKDVRISNAQTFQSILDKGGADAAADAAEKGGLEFSKVRVPFEVRGDRLLLGSSTAEGSLIAVKVEGEVNEASNQIDLVGVISPLYQLSKPIDKIPILGQILSGGEGEGIFAMTFQVEGTLDEPSFSVDPLSLLAPGFLRKIFSGRSERPNEKFLESLNREID